MTKDSMVHIVYGGLGYVVLPVVTFRGWYRLAAAELGIWADAVLLSDPSGYSHLIGALSLRTRSHLSSA